MKKYKKIIYFICVILTISFFVLKNNNVSAVEDYTSPTATYEYTITKNGSNYAFTKNSTNGIATFSNASLSAGIDIINGIDSNSKTKVVKLTFDDNDYLTLASAITFKYGTYVLYGKLDAQIVVRDANVYLEGMFRWTDSARSTRNFKYVFYLEDSGKLIVNNATINGGTMGAILAISSTSEVVNQIVLNENSLVTSQLNSQYSQNGNIKILDGSANETTRFIMNGGTLSNTGEAGHALIFQSAGIAEIHGGTISSSFFGISASNGTFNMDGGSISGYLSALEIMYDAKGGVIDAAEGKEISISSTANTLN